MASLKGKILQLANETRRGLDESPEEKERMRMLFQEMENFNPNPDSLKCPSTSGTWDLKYTTSDGTPIHYIL